MNPERPSRAGDAFHYRWVAKRTLKLLDPNTNLRAVVLDGLEPDEGQVDGDSVVDATEISIINGIKNIVVSQLKHSTLRVDQEYTLSDFKGTFEGFSTLYKRALITGEIYSFQIVTNRPFSSGFRDSLKKINLGETVSNQFVKTIETYTGLEGEDLKNFSKSISLIGKQGNYLDQQKDLAFAISDLVDRQIDSLEVNDYIQFITDYVLPGKHKEITKVEVLRRLGVNDLEDLFPAPSRIEPPKHLINRSCYGDLVTEIVNANTPIVITAEGGVGKTVTLSAVSKLLPNGSQSVLYDCFGQGDYRNLAHARHQHQHAFLQIVNECAQKLLCGRKLKFDTDTVRATKTFFRSLKKAAEELKKANSDSLLVLFIDASDNAKMAANLFKHHCFVDILLNERMPEGVKLVVSTRPERVDLLDLPDEYEEFKIKPFDLNETEFHLKTVYPNATLQDADELYRLTDGNPRVQRTVFILNRGSKLVDLLLALGPKTTTCDEQIATLLDKTVARVRKEFSLSGDVQFNSICHALANLPPPVPIEVLSKIAQVSVSAIKTFVTEIGIGFLLRNSTVQFRDEPTETWFRDRFKNTTEEAELLVDQVSTIASSNSYAAICLPQLLLEAEKYELLTTLALAEDNLFGLRDSDRKEIVAGRLKFALSAALQNEFVLDASKIALRAGEEFAGDQRRLSLFANHLDLLPQLLDEANVLDIAYKRQIKSGWGGSQYLYSASILSAYSSYKADARSYLRTGIEWFRLHIREVNEQQKENRFAQYTITKRDFCELFRTVFLLNDCSGLSYELKKWRRNEFFLEAFSLFISSLVDKHDYEAIFVIANKLSHNIMVILAVSHALGKVGRFLDAQTLLPSLFILAKRRHAFDFSKRSESSSILYSSYIYLCEAALHGNMDSKLIVRVVRCYREQISFYSLTSDHDSDARINAIRSLVLESTALGEKSLSSETALERLQLNEQNLDIEKGKKYIDSLLQLYLERAYILNGNQENIESRLEKAKACSKKISIGSYNQFSPFKLDVTRVRIELLKLIDSPPETEIKSLSKTLFGAQNSTRFDDLISLFKLSFHCKGLSKFRKESESACRTYLNNPDIEEQPESIASYYVEMSRSCMTQNKPDSVAYFQYAIDSVSRFGDEAVSRWEVHQKLVTRLTGRNIFEAKLTYRVSRAFELFSEHTGSGIDHLQDPLLDSLSKLDSKNTIALVSRWADRDFGYLNDTIYVVLKSLLQQNIISPQTCWGFTGFLGLDTQREIVDDLYETLFALENGELIFRQLCKDFLKSNPDQERLENLRDSGLNFNFNNTKLDDAIIDLNSIKKEVHQNATVPTSYLEEAEKCSDWAFESIPVYNEGGVTEFLSKVRQSDEATYELSYLWPTFWNNVDASQAISVLTQIAELSVEENMVHLTKLIDAMPSDLRSRPSVEQYWDNFRESVVSNWSASLLSEHQSDRYNYIFTKPEESEWDINHSILTGVKAGNYEEDPDSLFQLTTFLSKKLQEHEQIELLEYGLSRIEKQLPKDYSEGKWSQDLSVSGDEIQCLASLLWFLLGAPDSKIRWQAMHTVRRLALAESNELIEALHDHLEVKVPRPFRHQAHLPYHKNSILYFFVSLARSTKDNSKSLRTYSNIYYTHAIETNNIMINLAASKIATDLQKDESELYTNTQLENLATVSCSKFETASSTLKQSRHEFSNWSNECEIYLPYDFEEKWLYPIALIFDIDADSANKQLIDLIRTSNDFEITKKHIKDERKALFDSYSRSRRSHSNGYGYPQVWRADFYAAAHALFTLTKKLINEKPMVRSDYIYEDSWKDWIKNHSISRADGYWLADLADPLPIRRRKWVNEHVSSDWCWNIQENDFIDCLKDGENFIILEGNWYDNVFSNQERIQIDFRLVEVETSDTLLSALWSREWVDERDLILDSEIDRSKLHPEFHLRKIISTTGWDKGVDESDPRSDGISNYFGKLDSDLIETLNLEDSIPSKNLVSRDSPKIKFEFEKWNEDIDDSQQEYSRHGSRFKGTIDGIQLLMAETKMNIAVTVAIYREEQRYEKDRYGNYPEPYAKHFILSPDGTIRDNRNSYKLW